MIYALQILEKKNIFTQINEISINPKYINLKYNRQFLSSVVQKEIIYCMKF